MKAFTRFKNDFLGKKVLVLGLGLLGRGADVARILAEIGCQVTVSDLKTKDLLRKSIRMLKPLPIKYRLGEHRQEDVLEAQVIIRNPAVPWQHELLKMAREKQIPIHMDSSLFAKYFPGKIIGITGTRGKTTTTILIHKIISKAWDHKVILAGNATQKANISFLRKSKAKLAVMELSSWELQGWISQKLSPQIAVITNIYQDHLNRYQNMQEYVKDKTGIFAFQKKTDWAVLNKDNPWTLDMKARVPSQISWFSKKIVPGSWKLKLVGDHNLENAAAAIRTSEIYNIKKELVKEIICRFKGVDHRLEKVEEISGVSFINDTTSTTPIATIKALESIKKPIILLVGGNSKNLEFGNLGSTIARNAKAVVILKGDVYKDLRKQLSQFKNLKILGSNQDFEESLHLAWNAAGSGDVVLLSPGFTSFAEFENEFDRGKRFKTYVRNLKESFQNKI